MLSHLPPLESLPAGHYPVIYCDPPWRFMTRGKGKHSLPQRARIPHYSTMTLLEMKSLLPVRRLATEKGVLLMWTFGAFYKQAIELGESWGFHYKTDVFHWRKLTKRGKPAMSMGYYSRKQVETVLLFTTKRGSPPVKSHSVRQLIEAPIREHSRKPDDTYDRIEALFDGPYLELFAQQKLPHWDAWGDNVYRYGFGGGKAGKARLTA